MDNRDFDTNDMNRKCIAAYSVDQNEAWLGKINLPDNKREKVIDGTMSPFEKYEGQTVLNFSCDFCIPKNDEYLGELIKDWNRNSDPELIRKIFNRIEELNGLYLFWE